MQIGESIRTSFEEIRAHKLRSVFTLTGVILGTVSLVTVLSLLEGVRGSVMKGFDDLGFDGVIIVSQKAPADRVQRAKAHFSRGIRMEDERVLRESGLIRAFAPVGETRGVVQSGTMRRRVKIFGITPDFAIAKNRGVSEGRFISARDQQGVGSVCVLGYKLKRRLFGGENALGSQVNVDGRRLTVVGIGRKFNTEMVNDRAMIQEMDSMYVPLSVYQTMYGRKDSIAYVLIKAADPEESVAAEGDARSLYARAHGGINDVNIENVGKEMLKERAQVDVILKNWLIVFMSIAGVSLIIGGVGIFSVLKISIGERLFEIGLRKAIGASDGEIFMQFLIESITLSTVGATIGLMLGSLLVTAISSKFPAGLSISTDAILVSAGFAMGVGLFAGLYPSIRAGKLEPVEALRS